MSNPRFDEYVALDMAVGVAAMSPCAKSKRGVVIFERDRCAIAAGFNHPPKPMRCEGTDACRSACNKICVHAEAAALRELAKFERPKRPLELLHVKVVDGIAVPSGPPSCWQCSREILDAGFVGRVWLLHEDGLRSYTALEFHEATLIHCGLPAKVGSSDPRSDCRACREQGCCMLHHPDAPRCVVVDVRDDETSLAKSIARTGSADAWIQGLGRKIDLTQAARAEGQARFVSDTHVAPGFNPPRLVKGRWRSDRVTGPILDCRLQSDCIRRTWDVYYAERAQVLDAASGGGQSEPSKGFQEPSDAAVPSAPAPAHPRAAAGSSTKKGSNNDGHRTSDRGDASRPASGSQGVERQGDVARAADPGRGQQDDAAVRVHEHGPGRSGPVAVFADGSTRDGLGGGRVDPRSERTIADAVAAFDHLREAWDGDGEVETCMNELGRILGRLRQYDLEMSALVGKFRQRAIDLADAVRRYGHHLGASCGMGETCQCGFGKLLAPDGIVTRTLLLQEDP